jgi:hypothetical protein
MLVISFERDALRTGALALSRRLIVVLCIMNYEFQHSRQLWNMNLQVALGRHLYGYDLLDVVAGNLAPR